MFEYHEDDDRFYAMHLMAFPKTAFATDLMIEAPGDVDAAQLEELRIKIKE
jgi:aspartyl-tRNA synthetase